MPTVPEFNKQPLKIIYNPANVDAPVSMKQKNYIITLHQRRKLPQPDLSNMTMGEAAQLISRMLN